MKILILFILCGFPVVDEGIINISSLNHDQNKSLLSSHFTNISTGSRVLGYLFVFPLAIWIYYSFASLIIIVSEEKSEIILLIFPLYLVFFFPL